MLETENHLCCVILVRSLRKTFLNDAVKVVEQKFSFILRNNRVIVEGRGP